MAQVELLKADAIDAVLQPALYATYAEMVADLPGKGRRFAVVTNDERVGTTNVSYFWSGSQLQWIASVAIEI